MLPASFIFGTACICRGFARGWHVQVHVFGEWASKIEALVRRLNHLHSIEPDAKSLVRELLAPWSV